MHKHTHTHTCTHTHNTYMQTHIHTQTHTHTHTHTHTRAHTHMHTHTYTHMRFLKQLKPWLLASQIAVAMVMEGMLPELDDLESKGYFSRSELKEVIKKRQDFEYNFKRRATLKRDFLKWVQVLLFSPLTNV